MDKLDVVNGLIFQKLKITSKDTLKERVILQKKVYLLQELGVDIGYSYNWYLKGPYSPGLTTYVYDRLDYLLQSSEELNKYKLNDDIYSKIQLVNSFSKQKPFDLSLDAWYELLASVRYVWKNPYLWEIDDISNSERIIDVVRSEKPHFTIEHCKKAITLLQEHGLVYF